MEAKQFQKSPGAKAHKDWIISQWNKALQTDESMFEIWVKSGSNMRISERQRVRERATTPCITPTVKYGKGLILVLGAFGNSKVRDWYQEKGKLNLTCYHSILQHHTNPDGTWHVVQGFVLMQDNDLNNTSKFCQRYIKSKEKLRVLQLLSWPAQSTDLNPIELMWNELDRKIRAKQATNTAHL